MIEYLEYITRLTVQDNPDKIFLFGDNLLEKGFGGQAAAMRGEPNAIGIPTKKLPFNNSAAFFDDKEFEENKKYIDEAFAKIPKDKIIVIPTAGLGTGRAKLDKKAPKTFAYLQSKLKTLK